MSDTLMSMQELADHLGLSHTKLIGEMTRFETKLHGNRVNEGKATVTYFDRAQAMEWAQLLRRQWQIDQEIKERASARPRPQNPRGQLAAPRTPSAFKRLTLSRELRINFERATQAQDPLYTPNGVGNGVERQFGFGRGS